MEVHRFLKNGDHKNKSQCCQLAQHPVDIAAMAAVMIVQVSTERENLVMRKPGGHLQAGGTSCGRRHFTTSYLLATVAKNMTTTCFHEYRVARQHWFFYQQKF